MEISFLARVSGHAKVVVLWNKHAIKHVAKVQSEPLLCVGKVVLQANKENGIAFDVARLHGGTGDGVGRLGGVVVGALATSPFSF